MALSSEEQRTSELDDVETLMRLYKAKVLRFVAFSLGDRDAAESITHDCLLKAHASRAQFRGDCSVNSWLMRIAVNLVRNHAQSRRLQFWKKIQNTDNGSMRECPDRRISPEEHASVRQQVEAVWEATRQLSHKQRTVFLLKYLEELEVKEIAQSTGMTENTVKVHLFRAVRNVRKRLGASR